MRVPELKSRLAERFAEVAPSNGRRVLRGRSPSEGGEPYEAVLDEATGELSVYALTRIHGGAHAVNWVPGDIDWHGD